MLLFNMLKKLYVCVCVRVRESVQINDRRRCSSLRTLEDRKKRLSSCLSQTSIVSDISLFLYQCLMLLIYILNMPFLIWSWPQKLSKCAHKILFEKILCFVFLFNFMCQFYCFWLSKCMAQIMNCCTHFQKQAIVVKNI